MKKYLALIFVFVHLTAAAETLVHESEAPYGIMGGTEQQLREQMNLFRIVDQGKKYDADTQWNIKWQYEYTTNASVCMLSQSKVNIDVVYHLPQWMNADAAEPSLREKWQTYMTHLRAHELGHARNGENAADEIENMLKNLAPMPTCKVLEEVANERAKAILVEHNAWDAEYDRLTGHGRTQGAVFP